MPFKWIVAGVGDVARRRVIPAILAERSSELYGVVTRDPRKAEPYGVRAWVALRDALRDGAFDAVYIATPVAMHAPLALAALQAGKHVLCEKPMAMNYAEAESLVAAASAPGAPKFGVAYYRRLYPKLQRVRELLREDAIGQPVLAEANCHGAPPPVDRAWLLDPALAGGGPLYDVACHRIDVFNFLFGDPDRIAALLSNALYQVPVEDSATVMIDYADRVRAIVDVRWNSWIPRDQFRILGARGEIDLDPLNGPSLRLRTAEGEHCENLPSHSNLHYPIVANFVDAVAGKADLACPAAEAAKTDWVIEQTVKRSPRGTANG